MKKILLLCVLVLFFGSCEKTSYRVVRTKNPTNTSAPEEKTDFESLMIKDKLDKNQRSAAVLNQLFNDSPIDKVSAVIIENKTNCDIIVRITGATNHLLPIYKNDRNFLILDKGNYTFSANLCRAKYLKQKKIAESVTVTLSER